MTDLALIPIDEAELEHFLERLISNDMLMAQILAKDDVN